MTDQASITVNGVKHKGWTDVSISFGIDQLAGSFSLSFADRWSTDPFAKAVSIREGDECEVKIADELVLTGYVDDFHETESRSAHSMSVSGRSKTGDLVDCSAILDGWQLKQKKIEDIAAALCEPFGIGVELLAPNPLQPLDTGDKVRIFRVEQGETVHEALLRLTRKTGLVMQTTAQGNLQLSRAPKIPLSGVFIIRSEAQSNVIDDSSYDASFKDRFSQYLLKSQTGANDDTSGANAAQLEEIVTDDEVGRYRPLLVLAEHPSDRSSLKTRAAWERNRRAASSERLSYVQREWRNLAGIWQPNTLIRVDDDRYDVHDFMLVSGATLTQSKEGGTKAALQVTGREAYDVFDPPKRRRKR